MRAYFAAVTWISIIIAGDCSARFRRDAVKRAGHSMRLFCLFVSPSAQIVRYHTKIGDALALRVSHIACDQRK
jgi:hypothetical protein